MLIQVSPQATMRVFCLAAPMAMNDAGKFVTPAFGTGAAAVDEHAGTSAVEDAVTAGTAAVKGEGSLVLALGLNGAPRNCCGTGSLVLAL